MAKTFLTNEDRAALEAMIAAGKLVLPLKVSEGGTGATNATEALKNLGAVRVATGSYTGTGTNGVDNPNSLTFDFAPKIVIVFKSSYNTFAGELNYLNGYYSDAKQEFFYGGSRFSVFKDTAAIASTTYAFNGNTLTWYNSFTHATEANWSKGYAMQMNSTGVEYHYIAIG